MQSCRTFEPAEYYATMRRADRLFQLVQFLRTRRAATGRQIADELRVSVRTVYRDILDLQTSGIPIRGEAGVGWVEGAVRGVEVPVEGRANN